MRRLSLRRDHTVPALREWHEIASLTPRSYDACMRLGIDLQTLQPSKLEDFLDKDGDRVIAEKKLRHANARRARNIELATKEREKTIREEERLLLKSQASTTAVGDLKSIGIAGADTATYLDLERKRLEKVKLLRQKEMQRLVEAEAKAAELIARNAAREAHELAAKEAREAARKQRQDEHAKRAATIELERKAKAERELQNQKEITARFRTFERRRLEIEVEEKERRRKEAERLRAEQAAADEARRRDLAVREQARLEMQSTRLAQMIAAEEAVAAKMEEAKRLHAAQMLERRLAAEERIAKALAESAAKQERIMSDFERKTQEANARAAANEEAMRQKIAEEAREREANAAQKRAKKEMVMREAEERVQRLLAEANTGEASLAEHRARREREFELRKLEHDLKLADKVEICTSMQRAAEYQRVRVSAPVRRHALPAQTGTTCAPSAERHQRPHTSCHPRPSRRVRSRHRACATWVASNSSCHPRSAACSEDRTRRPPG
jgi:hypothetical protein